MVPKDDYSHPNSFSVPSGLTQPDYCYCDPTTASRYFKVGEIASIKVTFRYFLGNATKDTKGRIYGVIREAVSYGEDNGGYLLFDSGCKVWF